MSRSTSPTPTSLQSPHSEAISQFRGPGRVPEVRLGSNNNVGPVILGNDMTINDVNINNNITNTHINNNDCNIITDIQKVKLEIDVNTSNNIDIESIQSSPDHVSRKVGQNTIKRTYNSNTLLGDGGRSVLNGVEGWEEKVDVIGLYGSAMTVIVPKGWKDVSGIRQVPDHQEVWQDLTTGAKGGGG